MFLTCSCGTFTCSLTPFSAVFACRRRPQLLRREQVRTAHGPLPIRSAFMASGTYSAQVLCCSRSHSAPIPEAGTRTGQIYNLYNYDHGRRWIYTECIIVTPAATRQMKNDNLSFFFPASPGPERDRIRTGGRSGGCTKQSKSVQKGDKK